MSRTQKGAKAPSYEYWSRRPFNKFGGAIGKYAKRRTHKAERREPTETLLTSPPDWMFSPALWGVAP
jgi:hypothetical protein